MPFLSLVAIVLLAPPSPWNVEFTGKSGFGHLTRVFALSDRIVFLDSPPPTESDGGDIYLWRDRDATPTKTFSVSEQGIRQIRQFGKDLVVPGIDAMENWDWGNWYLSADKGETWTKFRNLPKAMHVFDAAEWHGKFYMGICDPEGAVVESPTGKQWTKAFGHASKDSFGEVLSLVPLPDALYAFWTEQWGDGNVEANKKVDCYRFDGKSWEPRKYFPGVTSVWNSKVLRSTGFILLGKRSYTLRNDKVEPILALDGLSPVDVEDLGAELVWLAYGPDKACSLYRSSFNEAKGEVGKVEKILDLPADLHGECIAVHGTKVYVGCAGSPSGQLISVPLSKVR